MAVRETPWPEGTPSWADLAVDDIAGAQAYYAALFGWTYTSAGEQAGGYQLALVDGKVVAGLGPKQDAHQPTVWTAYLAVDDADETSGRIASAGGTVIAPPFDVMDAGRMAVAADSVGATIGIWQARASIGAERTNEPGALCWNELHTRDYERAREFYAQVFGFDYTDLPGDDFTYSMFKRVSDGQDVGGIHHDTTLPPDASSYWLSWFAVADTDATAATAAGLGSTLVMPAADSPFGRMAVVQAATGEVFGIIALPSSGE